MSFELKGEESLKLKFKGLKLSPREAVIVVTAAAIPVESQAKRTAPFKSGQLKRDIHIEAEKTSSGAVAVIGNSGAVPYAARQEFGFSGADSLGRVYNDPGRPYLRPALRSQRKQATAAARKAIKSLIRRAA